VSIKRNSIYNLGGGAATMAIMLIAVPLYLDLIGPVRFGVLSLVWLLSGYFGSFDLGIGRATAFALARQQASHQTGNYTAQVFWTALALSMALGLLGALAIYLFAPLLFLHVFNTPPPLASETLAVLPWIAAGIPLLTIESALTGVLTGKEQFRALNIRSALAAALTQFLPLLAVWQIAPRLDIAIPATIMARSLAIVLFLFIARKAAGANWRPDLFDHRSQMRELLRFAGWVTLNRSLAQLIVSLDRFLIAALLTPVALVLYSVPFQLVSRGAMVSSALSSALFPRMTRLEPVELREVAVRAMRANGALMLVLCAGGIIALPWFLELWIDREFADGAALVGQLIGCSLWLNAVALIPHNLLEAQGTPKQVFSVGIVQIVPYAVFAAGGATLIGVTGIALAHNLRTLADLLMLAWRARLFAETISVILWPLALLAACILVPTFAHGWPWIGLAAQAALIMGAAALAFHLFPEARRLVARAIVARLHS